MQSPLHSPRGELLQQYVCARITDLRGIDIGLFDYDRNNALYYFIMNADEYIYMRYGGRDADAADKYLDHDSLQLALEKGLELHEQYKAGKLPEQPRPAPFFPREIPLLKKMEMDRGRCVECHLIHDYTLQQKEKDGTLNKLHDMYSYPDIERIGIKLDIPMGLAVKSAKGPAAEAGLQPGDVITAFNGTAVYTFGDLQYRYDKVPRPDTESIELTVQRGDAAHDLTIALPPEWWWTDIYYRFFTIDPEYYFFTELLTDEEKAALDLPKDGFAARITDVDPAAKVFNVHSLKVDDIITAVDGVESDSFTKSVEVYIKLNVTSGETVTLTALRGDEKLELPLKPQRQYFRKRPAKE